MRYMVEEIFGPKIAEQMGDFWTVDKEGEIKGAFKPCGRRLPLLLVRLRLTFCRIDPALWYHGGTQGKHDTILALSRCRPRQRFLELHSQFIARLLDGGFFTKVKKF
jgi:hypothetical protein